jgi:hypothetical protein
MTCSYDIVVDAPFGTYTISATRVDSCDVSGGALSTVVLPGTVEVLDPCCCAVGPGKARPVDLLLFALFPSGLWLRRRAKGALRKHMLAILCLVTVLYPASPIHAREPRAASGAWTFTERGETTGLATRESARRWYLSDIHHEGDTFSARLAMTGGSPFGVGTLDGRLVFPGGRIYAEITDDAGRHVATVTGWVTRSGLEGRFDGIEGQRGSWTWTAPGAATWAALYEEIAPEGER